MFISRLGRSAIVISMLALAAGCSSGITGFSRAGPSATGSQAANNPCSWNPRSCIHKGSYEPNERAYAEQEAARLNQASLERLRRSTASR
jgi:hypothetical protein